MTEYDKDDTKGVVVVRDKEQRTLVAETFYSEEEGFGKLKSWVDTMIQREKGDNMGATVDYYELPDMAIVEGRSDKQIGLLMEGLKPDEHIRVIEAVYTDRQGRCPYNEDSIRRTIAENPERFERFVYYSNPLMATLNKPVEVNLAEGEFCHAERVFEMKNNFSFTGGDYIRDGKDVAYIFRQLGQKAVENSFCLLQKGDKSYILHLGIGNAITTMVDTTAVLTAAKRLDAERVWFIHNHPSGQVYASQEDHRMWDKLHNALGDVLQEGIIINTDSGKYGVFTTHYNEVMKMAGPGLADKEKNIPVLAFDRTVFHDRDADYKTRSFTSASQVAEFVSTQRFGQRDCMSFLAMDSQLQVRGNFHMPDNKLEGWHEKISYIADVCMKTGATNVFVYAGKGVGTVEEVDLPQGLAEKLRKMTAGTVRFTDLIIYERAGENLKYYSYFEEGRLSERPSDYKTRDFDSIDIIPVRGGKGMIRVSIGGVQQPAEMIRETDMKMLQQGQIDKEQLARSYCRHLMDESMTEKNKGFKR